VLADNSGNGKVCAATAVGSAPELQMYGAGSGGDGMGGALASNDVCRGSGTPAAGGASGGSGGTAGASDDVDAGGASGASNDAGAGG
jgi:hypothetical protein